MKGITDFLVACDNNNIVDVVDRNELAAEIFVKH